MEPNGPQIAKTVLRNSIPRGILHCDTYTNGIKETAQK